MYLVDIFHEPMGELLKNHIRSSVFFKNWEWLLGEQIHSVKTWLEPMPEMLVKVFSPWKIKLRKILLSL